MRKITDILQKQILTYKKWKRCERLPEDHEDHLDSSYAYDCSVDLINDLNRGECDELLESAVKMQNDELLEDFLDDYSAYYAEPCNRMQNEFVKFAKGKLTAEECQDLLAEYASQQQ